MPCKIKKCTMPEKTCTKLCTNWVSGPSFHDVMELYGLVEEVDLEYCNAEVRQLATRYMNAVESSKSQEIFDLFDTVKEVFHYESV